MRTGRGMRKEDRNAEAIAHAVELRGKSIFDSFCLEIEKLPEVLLLRRAAKHVTETEWRRFIAVLARSALQNERTLHIVNDFNRLYVFPHRKMPGST